MYVGDERDMCGKLGFTWSFIASIIVSEFPNNHGEPWKWILPRTISGNGRKKAGNLG